MLKLCLLVLVVGTSEPQPAVRLVVTPLVSTARLQDMHILVMVVRHEDNRWIDVSADSDEFRRVSGWQLDGDRAPFAFDWWWPALPCGDYLVMATIQRVDGSVRRDRAQARYVGCTSTTIRVR